MKTTYSLLILAALISFSTASHARKPCEELKQEISAKLDAKGVRQFSLDVVAADAADTRKTVGTCDGGTQRIVYRRDTPTAALAKR